MCGISGTLNARGIAVKPASIEAMNKSLAHRGPDGSGVWVEDFIGLGHTRLSILDLSINAKQPMQLLDTDRYVITYNGEVYNFKELRSDLEYRGVRFKSSSDTEVILASYKVFGEQCFLKFNGMFALAIWDREEKQLILARDRYGIKPLYYYSTPTKFIFASEQKAILKELKQLPKINDFALYQYFSFQNIFTNETFYEDINILEPGSITKVKYNVNSQFIYTTKKYWDYNFDIEQKMTKNEYQEELTYLLEQSVKRQLVSDVEVGSYLSGGMDSGAISTLASRQLPDLKTFTCGFDLTGISSYELSLDERQIAEAISAACGTEHYEYLIKSGDIVRNIRAIVSHLEEPRVGQSYPNYCAARLASKFTKVCMSGAGGDELFAGYPWRYRHFETESPEEFKQRYFSSWQRLTTKQQRSKLMKNTPHEDFETELQKVFYGIFGDNHTLGKSWDDDINACLYFEAKTFLHGLLVVEDKLSMAHGLEIRLPFLDNDIVDFASKCPPRLKLEITKETKFLDENNLVEKKKQADVKGKVLLRNAMKKILPKHVVELKKQGFSAPDATWFRNNINNNEFLPLDETDNTLYSHLNHDVVKELIDEHRTGEANKRLFIWSILYCWHWFNQQQEAQNAQ